MYFTTIKWWDCGVCDRRLCKVLRQKHRALCPPSVLASKAQKRSIIKSQKPGMASGASDRRPVSGNAAALEVSPASQE